MTKKPPKHYPPGLDPATRKKVHDQQRGSAHSRGYTRRWQAYSGWFLSQEENALCACGCGNPSEETDHIQPVTGPDDPLFWNPDNHQGLCGDCHKRKTIRESGALKR